MQCATTAKADGSYELHLVPGVYDLRGAPSHVSGGSGCGVGGPVTVTASSPAQSVVVHCDIR